jgi:hypothetical protein
VIAIHEQIWSANMRTRVLDAVDSRIESQESHRAVQERLEPPPARPTRSSVVEVVEP